MAGPLLCNPYSRNKLLFILKVASFRMMLFVMFKGILRYGG